MTSLRPFLLTAVLQELSENTSVPRGRTFSISRVRPHTIVSFYHFLITFTWSSLLYLCQIAYYLPYDACWFHPSFHSYTLSTQDFTLNEIVAIHNEYLKVLITTGKHTESPNIEQSTVAFHKQQSSTTSTATPSLSVSPSTRQHPQHFQQHQHQHQLYNLIPQFIST